MRKLTIYLSLLYAFIATAMTPATVYAAEGGSVIKLSDFNPNKCYTVTTTVRGGWSVKADGSQFCSTNDAGFGTTTDASKTQNRFAVLTIDNENYYLFSVHANKFIKKDRTLVKGPGDAIEFADAGDGERVRVNFKNIVNSYINLGGSNQMTIDGWHTMDEGNRVKFTEVDDFDPTAAIEMLKNPEIEIENYFAATTVTDGEFAQGTIWYTLQIAANGFVIDNNGSNKIPLDDFASDPTDEAQLWAFTGDNENGYTLYNKQAGTSKVLAAPKTMTGKEGGTSYPILVDANNIPDGYTELWQFVPSSDLGTGDTYFYMYEKEYPANKVNNRDNILAFWSGGADAGSTLNIRVAMAEYKISTKSGEWTASNSAGTWASTWQSTAVPHVMLKESQGRNNMAAYNNDGDIQLFTCLESAAVNGVHTATYMLYAEEGYHVANYSFNFVSSDGEVTVTTADGVAVTADKENRQNISATNTEEISMSFVVSASSNVFANTSDFYATIIRNTTPVEESTEIFTTKQNAIPYRIPAIAMASNGDLIAVADYRHSGSDIGVVNNGRIDLHARISNDNGVTWNDKFDIVVGQGASSPDFMHVGFGDPCIVADRESDRVLVLSCAGNVSFQNGTRNNHQNIARFYSEDNGAKWSEPEDIADEIYAMWDKSSTHGPVMAMFIGSGKIHQSRYVKVKDYYRLYCAVLLKNKNATYTNFVLYSDDFGGSWDVLGGVENAPIPNGADEPKVEELPNGNIIVSSRCNGGRHFNIFTFTDAKKAEGSWGTRATSNAGVNGINALGNSCNGEILIMPAVRNEDGKEMWIALQSVPFGSGRTNVGIYYKALESEEDYNTPANFAKDWDGRHQSSYIGSAYSTMCFQKDSTIAFLYEESTYGADYTIQYKNYSLETITDSAYSVLPFTVESDNNIETYIPATITPANGETVGSLSVITLDFTPNYPRRLDDYAIITVVNSNGDLVENAKLQWNANNMHAVDVVLNNEITDAGKYIVTIPSYSIFSMDDFSCNPEIVLEYTISTTGIANIENVKVDGKIYDVSGREKERTENGINIINGKKILIK
ncbi:MAG: exo-alpha-sialidase [Bacteroidaceae bacterium]|nr:exo-alpha-sialidase [Bacteroidaceae bacterium]